MDCITNRQASDVDNIRAMNIAGWSELSTEEKEKWYAPHKGAINASDLNRIVTNLIEITQGVESIIGNTIGGTSTNPTPKTDWTMRDIPRKNELQQITKYYTTLSKYTPFDSVDVDLFRFCTYDNLNDFEKKIHQIHTMLEDIQNNGRYKHAVEWYKMDNSSAYKVDRKAMGIMTMQAVIPFASSFVVNKYYPNGTLYETLSHSAYKESDRIFEFEGSTVYLYEFVCTMPGAEIYTLGKVGM